MSSSAESYLKVSYDLRPAKQVERRIFIDAFQGLAQAGFQISDYQYTGFGSIYFVDFILFHKFLGITKMLSIERDYKIKKRVYFNRPYKTVDIRMDLAKKVIPTLSSRTKHILWLDYDQIIDEEKLYEVILASGHLSSGSIILVTLDASPPGTERDEMYGISEWKKYYSSVAENYLGGFSDEADFKLTNLCRVNVGIIHNAIKSALVHRAGVKFVPMFNFLYADGRHPMVTCGGMIASSSDEEKLKESDLRNKPYYMADFSKPPFEIRVPKVTRKERLYLDSNMPCQRSWRAEKFNFSAKDIAEYRKIYRYIPAYAEMML